MKKILFLFAVLLTAVSASAYDFKVYGIYYNVLSAADLTCKVTWGDSQYTGDVVIPASVTYNGRTFSVTKIGDEAFYGCSSLTSVEIPNSVTEIGSEAFSNCTSLTSVEIPNSVTTIGEDAFYGCSSLTSVVIPNSVTTIGSYAFSGCSSLTSVEIPNSVTTIRSYAFQGCSSLTSVEIPNSVTKIGNFSFWGCSSLTSVEIGNSVTEIGSKAFYCCTNLTEIISLNTTPPTASSSTFEEVSKTDCIIKVPAEAVGDYKVADGWKEFYNIVAIEDEVGVESVRAEGMKDARAYTLEGREARTGQRGLVIERGKKIIR